MSEDLIAWLRAQLDEDEAIAQRATWDSAPTGNEWRMSIPTASYERLIVADGYDDGVAIISPENGDAEALAEHIARHNPAVVLADIAAKRAILDRYEKTLKSATERSEDFALKGAALALLGAVHLLASAYRHRDGYREEWRP